MSSKCEGSKIRSSSVCVQSVSDQESGACRRATSRKWKGNQKEIKTSNYPL